MARGFELLVFPTISDCLSSMPTRLGEKVHAVLRRKAMFHADRPCIGSLTARSYIISGEACRRILTEGSWNEIDREYNPTGRAEVTVGPSSDIASSMIMINGY